MARRVFFSFHYERDIWRANVVRNSWVTQDREAAGFWDASLWETAKKEGDEAIKRMIDKGLKNTSVTVVLIGKETSNRKWVRYELKQSWKIGNGILGVFIHQIKDKHNNTDAKGDTAFGPIFTSPNDNKKYFFERFKTYDWIDDNGYKNFGEWVEKAAKQAGR